MHEETLFDFTVNQDIITFIFIDFMTFSKHPVDSYAMLNLFKLFSHMLCVSVISHEINDKVFSKLKWNIDNKGYIYFFLTLVLVKLLPLTIIYHAFGFC